MKIILGTAAFSGRPYGRSGAVVNPKEAARIIEHALTCDIKVFDTSPAYGDAEQILSSFMAKGITVYSKQPMDRKFALDSLYKLSPSTVHFLIHNWDGKKPVPQWASGHSAYSADTTLESSLHGGHIKQYDANILNRRVSQRPGTICRSVFAQGALITGTCPSPMVAIMVAEAKKLADALRIPLPALALQWALQNTCFDGVVIGPTSLKELKEIIAWSRVEVPPLSALVNLLPSDSSAMDCRTWKEVAV